MTLMRVKELAHDPNTQQTIVVLETPTEWLHLGLLLPVNEANRLARVLGLTSCPCVPVFELVEALLAHFAAPLVRVVLDGAEAGVSATLYVKENEGEAAFRCHPADALALALRAQVPIYATAEALSHACPVCQPHRHEPDFPDVSLWLEQVRPEDFEG